MSPSSGLRSAAIAAICIATGSVASAQNRSVENDPTPQNQAATSDAPQTLTGKERLGRKWNDEQRIDNCKVPVAKRGTQPRLDTCPDMS